MPTYRLQCQHCRGEFETWISIHDELPKRHDVSIDPINGTKCQGELVQVITRVATYGVGSHGQQTLSTDAHEKNLARNRDAYHRLRMEGHQPVGMMGSQTATRKIPGAYELETKAKNEWEIKTGGLVSVPDDRTTEINEMMADAGTSGTSVEQIRGWKDDMMKRKQSA